MTNILAYYRTPRLNETPIFEIDAAIRAVRGEVDFHWSFDHYPDCEEIGFFVDHSPIAGDYPFAYRPAAKRFMDSIQEGDHAVFFGIVNACRSIGKFAGLAASLTQRGTAVHVANAGVSFEPEVSDCLRLYADLRKGLKVGSGTKSKPDWQFNYEPGIATGREFIHPTTEELRSGDKVVVCFDTAHWRSVRKLLEQTSEWMARGVIVHFQDLGIDAYSREGLTMLRTFTKLEHAAGIEVGDWLSASEKAVSGAGSRKVVRDGKVKRTLDEREVSIIWWIAHMRDHHKMAFGPISDVVERGLAYSEVRKEIPRKGSKIAGGPNQGKYRQRQWTPEKCRSAYRRWPKIQAILEEGVRRGYSG